MSETKAVSHIPSNTHAATAAAVNPPIVIDLGKKNRKAIRKLKKGKPGKLLAAIEQSLAHLRESGELSGSAQPVLVVVKERPKRGLARIAKLWGVE